MAVLKLALPVEGATLDSGLEFQRGNSEVSLTAITPLSGWGYRKSITIDNTGNANALTDYQIRINLDSTNFDFTKAKSDGSDVRITDSDGTTFLPLWIEKWDIANQQAVIWTKVPSIPASSTYTIYLYYGNPSATSVSDGDAVFELFDDFDDGSYVGKWTVLGGSWVESNGILSRTDATYHGAIKSSNGTLTDNVVVECKAKTTSNERFCVGIKSNADISTGLKDTYYAEAHGRSDLVAAEIWDGTTFYPKTAGVVVNNNTWYILKGAVSGDTLIASIYDTSRNLLASTSRTHAVANAGDRVIFQSYLKMAVDWVLVRKYTSPEPTTTVGAEEIGYPTNSPVSIFPEIDSGSSSTVWDMSSIVNRENLAGETGSIKYQYSCHNTSGSPVWNGTWLTLAQLQAEPDPTGRYFQLKAQFISDGSQGVSLAEMYIGADVPVGVGTCDYPPESDVRQGVSYDNGAKTGTLIIPYASDVRDGTVFDNGTIGTLDLPAETDVRQGTSYDNNTKIGTLDLPAVSDVREGVIYDNNSKTGTLDLPVEADVREGVVYDNGTKIGTLDLPAEGNVREGVVYDNGTKVGTLKTSGVSFELPLEIIDTSDKYEVVNMRRIEIVKGDTVTKKYQLKKNGSPVDISGMTISLGVKTNYTDTDYIISPINATIEDAVNGKFSFTFGPPLTDNVVRGVFEMIMVDSSGNRTTLTPPGGVPFVVYENIID